jgi:hypothetical protein
VRPMPPMTERPAHVTERPKRRGITAALAVLDAPRRRAA